MHPSEPFAIIGMGCRFPGGIHTPADFWQLLCQGRETLGPIPADRWDNAAYYDPTPATPGKVYVRHGHFLQDVDQFDPEFFHIAPREAASMDPQQRLVLEVSWEALEDAALDTARLSGSQTGVFIGGFWDDYSAQRLYATEAQHIGRYPLLSNLRGMLAGRIAHALGLHGPNLQVDTACSSSLLAIHLACQALRTGDCDLALAGGVTLLLAPEMVVGLCQMQSLSADGRCKAFAAGADGFGLGEGCGVVVLKRLTDAHRDGDRIYAVIRGSATNHDGHSRTITTPNGVAQRALLQQALARSGLAAHQIHYVEAHGTGTELGDPIEVLTLAEVLGQGRSDPLWIGSVKGNLGHLNAAAGVAGLIKTVLMLQHGAIPPQRHFTTPNPRIPWSNLPIQVPTQLTPWSTTPRIAGVSAFGLTGANAHLILEEAPAPPSKIQNLKSKIERPAHLLTLSAHSEPALGELAQRYVDFFTGRQRYHLGDIGYTSHVGRTHFRQRLAVWGPDAAAVRAQLAAFVAGGEPTGLVFGVSARKRPKVAFLFTGQGAQYVGMGRALYETHPLFRQTVERCDAILQEQLVESILAVLYAEVGEQESKSVGEPSAAESKIQNLNSKIDDTTYTQPALFVLEYALAKLWQAWGIQPDIVLGHSVGDLVAACVAGVFNLEDALKLVAARGRLMGALPQDGAMVVLRVNEARVQAALRPYQDEVAIAAINGPQSVVISGRRAAVQAIVELVQAEGVKATPLTVSHAFHSPLMEPMVAEFHEVAQTISYHPPQLPLVSNVTGTLAGNEVTTPDYWVRHVRETVRFADGVQTLQEQGSTLLLELGPKPTLLSLAQTILDLNDPDGHSKIWGAPWAPKSKIYLPSLHPAKSDWQQMLESLGTFYVHGVPIDWESLDQGYGRRKVVLPTYAFQRQRYWTEPVQKRHGGAPLRPLIDKLTQSPAIRETICETAFSLVALPFLADHRVYNKVVSPGACQLSLMLSAAELTFGNPPALQLTNVVLPQALVISTGGERMVQAVLTPVSGTGSMPKATFQLLSFDPQDQSPNPATHATGMVTVQPVVSPTIVDLAVLRRQCDQPGDVAAFYRTTAQQQIALGPTFRWLADVWHGQAEDRPAALARLNVPTTVESLTGYLLHPGLLDACFQVASLTRSPAQHRETLLPFAIEQLQLEQPGDLSISSEWWCHAVETGEARWDLQLLDHRGRRLAQIVSFTMRPASPTTVRGADAWRDWLYTVDWQPVVAEPVEAPPAQTVAEPAKTWLIFADQAGIGETLAAQLQQAGNSPIIVSAGEQYRQLEPRHFHIRPDQPEDYQRVLAAVPHVYSVVHLWSLDAPAAQDGATLMAAARQGCEPVLQLAQALLRQPQAPAGLWLVTQDAQPVLAVDQLAGVAQAGLWGLGKVIALEHPELHCICLDLDGSASVDTQSAALYAEITRTGPNNWPETQIALRGGERYLPRLARLTTPLLDRLACQPDATYLIVGGLGGLGFAVAESLAAQGAKHLVLVGRSQPKGHLQPQLDALAAQGVVVRIAQVDVTNRQQLQSLLAQLDESYPLRGIVHAAGVLDDGALLQQNWLRFAPVLAPKLLGAWHLHALTRHLPLNFFVLFSSVASLFGNRGQANYAAANAFLDAFAHYRRAQGLPALTINWGAWAKIGLATDLVRTNQYPLAERGWGVIAPQQGLDALAYLLTHAPAQVGVAPMDWEKFFAGGEEPNPFFARFAAQMDVAQRQVAIAPPPSPQSEIRRQLEAALPPQRISLLTTYLQEEVARSLGLASLPAPQLGFSELGMDSLTALELRRRLEKGLQLSLPATLAFEYPTVELLGRYLQDEVLQLPATAAQAEATDKSDPAGKRTTLPAVEQLSDAELLAFITQEFAEAS